jgi:hypothetical protein
MNFAAWAPLIAEMTWDFHDCKLLRVSFSVTGMNARPRKVAADAAEDDGSTILEFCEE